MKVAFLVGPALGHVARALSIARALSDSYPQIEVHFISPARGDIEHVTMNPFPVHMVNFNEQGGDQFKRNLEAKLDSLKPDILCVDMTPLPWLYQIDLRDLRIIYLTNFFLTTVCDFDTAQSHFFAVDKDAWNAKRAALNLHKMVHAKQLYEVGETFLCDPIGLIPQSERLNGKFHAIGACVWEVPDTGQDEAHDYSEKTLVLSFGSTGANYPSRSTVLKIKQALACDKVVFFGQNSEGKDIGQDVQYKHAAISPFLQNAPLSITQGGAGSTYLSLQHGIPTAITSTNRNQEILGQCISQAGVGCLLDKLADMPSEDIVDCVAKMKQACGRFVARKTDGPNTAAALIARMCGATKPKTLARTM